MLIILLAAISVFTYNIGRLVGFSAGALNSEACSRTAVSTNPCSYKETPVDVVDPDLPLDSDSNRISEQVPEDYLELVEYYANKYMVSPATAEWIKRSIDCESNFKQYKPDGTILRGQAGEYGIAQFKQTTFDQWKKYYGLSELDILKAEDQIRLMILMFGTNREFHWTCAAKTK